MFKSLFIKLYIIQKTKWKFNVFIPATADLVSFSEKQKNVSITEDEKGDLSEFNSQVSS